MKRAVQTRETHVKFFAPEKRHLHLTNVLGIELCLRSSAIFHSITIHLVELDEQDCSLLELSLKAWRPRCKIRLEFIVELLSEQAIDMFLRVFRRSSRYLHDVTFYIRSATIADNTTRLLDAILNMQGEVNLTLDAGPCRLEEASFETEVKAPDNVIVCSRSASLPLPNGLPVHRRQSPDPVPSCCIIQ